MSKLISKTTSYLSLTAALAVATSAFAAVEMEKCKVVDKDGKGLIKEHKADCKADTHTCKGQNSAHDASSWILVPKGECDKIQKNDYNNLSKETKEKIEWGQTKGAADDVKSAVHDMTEKK